jgi:hypothetical protein
MERYRIERKSPSRSIPPTWQWFAVGCVPSLLEVFGDDGVPLVIIVGGAAIGVSKNLTCLVVYTTVPHNELSFPKYI